jgi:hypothetical protein
MKGEFVVLLTAIVCLAAASAPLPPVLSNQFVVQSTRQNVAEGVWARSIIAMDGGKGQLLMNHSTEEGFYAQLLRGDLGMTYIMYYRNNSVLCNAYRQATPPLPGPTFQGLTYTGVKVGPFGKPAHQFDLSVGKYVVTQLFDAETNLPVWVSNTEADETSRVVVSYLNGTVDASLFTVPAACTKSHAFQGTLRDNSLQEFSTDSAAFGGHPFTSRLDRFVPIDTSRSSFTVKPSNSEFTSYLVQDAPLPPFVDNSVFATPVRDQGWCGGCWGFSSTAATEVVYRKAHQLNQTFNRSDWFSVQSVLDCAVTQPNSTALIQSQGCFGGWPSTAMDHIVQHGIPYDRDYPYFGVTSRSCRLNSIKGPILFPLAAAFQTPSGNVTAMMQAVHQHGAVVAIILYFLALPYGNAFYSGGVYNKVQCTPGLSHAVTIVGYGTTDDGQDYWLIKNSVGQAWGEGGYFKLARGVNMCGVEDFGFVPVARLP